MDAVTTNPPPLLELLAHELRWQLVQALSAGDHRVQELVAMLDRPQNLISYHLRLLRQANLVRQRRSSHDGRDIYYSLEVARLQRMYATTGERLHPAIQATQPHTTTQYTSENGRPATVLFLCTQNSARSQMAEGILRAMGGERVVAHSAGSEPATVHPLAVRAMAQMGIDISGQASTHMDRFAGQPFDYIITVCDRLRESCPVFPYDPLKIHWSFPDPAAVEGSEEEQYRAFLQTARELATRISYLLLMIQRQQP